MTPELHDSLAQAASPARITDLGRHNSQGSGGHEPQGSGGPFSGKRKKTWDDPKTFRQGFSQSNDQPTGPASQTFRIDIQSEESSKSLKKPVLFPGVRRSSASDHEPFDLNVELGLDGKPLHQFRTDDHDLTGLQDGYESNSSDLKETQKLEDSSSIFRSPSQSKIPQLAISGGHQGKIPSESLKNVPPSTRPQAESKSLTISGIGRKYNRGPEHTSESGSQFAAISYQGWSKEDLKNPFRLPHRELRTSASRIPLKIVEYFAQPFFTKIQEIQDQSSGKIQKREILENNHLVLIHVLNNEDKKVKRFIQVLEEGTNERNTRKWADKMRGLVRWMLFAQITLLKFLRIPEEAQSEKCGDLFSWLLSEMFAYNHSTPLLGRIPDEHLNYDKISLSPVQEKIIHYLSLKHINSESYHHYSVYLVGIWYKSFHQDIWGEVFERDDHTFWRKLDKLMGDSRSFRGQLVNWDRFATVKPLLEISEDFQIHRIHQLVEYRHKEIFHRILDELKEKPVPHGFSKLENKFLEIMRQKNQEFDVKTVGKNTISKYDHPKIAFVWKKYQMKTAGQSVFAVRALDTTGTRLQGDNAILGKIRKLMKLTDCIHEKLKRLIPLVNCHDYPSHEEFLEWISSSIFSPHRGFPVEGIVGSLTKAQIDQISSNTKDFFGKVQMILLEILSNSTYSVEYYEYASSLLGFWYFQSKNDFWKIAFSNEKNYFSLIYKEFSKYYRD